MQTYSQIKADLYRLCGTTTSPRTDVVNAVALAIQRATDVFALKGDWSFLHQYQNRVDIPLAAPYSTGTVAVTQDSKTITGTGTTWTKDMEGDFFRLTSQEAYEIRAFSSTTSMDLAIKYQGSDDSGETYEVLKRFYPLPLNFLRPIAREAKLIKPGAQDESAMTYNENAAFKEKIETGRPTWFSVIGNTKRRAHYDTGTVTVATSGGVSTWTINASPSPTLPTDIVDREVRINGEERGYMINSRTGATTFTTYDTYYNPSDATSVATAVSYAITPKETQMIGFSTIPDQRYIFSMPYIKRMDDLILDADISPVVLAGYEDAFVAVCRMKMATDFRTLLMSGVDRQALINDGNLALMDAWLSEQAGQTRKDQARGYVDRRQVGPSWM